MKNKKKALETQAPPVKESVARSPEEEARREFIRQVGREIRAEHQDEVGCPRPE